MAKESIVIDWDGVNVPPELQVLPPGRYIVEPASDGLGSLTPEEEDGIVAALKSLDAGRGIPLSDVIREIRGSAQEK